MPGHPAAPAGPRRPASQGRTIALWGGAAALVLAAGGIAIGTVNAAVYSPEAQVERYLEALADGDGGTALGLSGAGADLAPGTATTLLDGAPLAAAHAHLGEVTVERREQSGDRAEVAVRYRVDGEDHSTVFTVDRTGRDWLFFDRWRMAEVPLQTVRVAPTSWPAEAAGRPLTATVNGAEVSLAGETVPSRDLAVLPPAVVDASATSTYLEAAPVRSVVDGGADGAAEGRPTPLGLVLRYTEAAPAEANRQLDEYLAGCTEQEVLNPTGCPMGYQTTNRVLPESISWLLAGDPTLRITPLAEAATAGAGDGNGEDSGDGNGGGEDSGEGSDGASTGQGVDLTVAAPVEVQARLDLQEIDLVTGEQRPVEHVEDLRLEGDLRVTPESVAYRPQVP